MATTQSAPAGKSYDHNLYHSTHGPLYSEVSFKTTLMDPNTTLVLLHKLRADSANVIHYLPTCTCHKQLEQSIHNMVKVIKRAPSVCDNSIHTVSFRDPQGSSKVVPRYQNWRTRNCRSKNWRSKIRESELGFQKLRYQSGLFIQVRS